MTISTHCYCGHFFCSPSFRRQFAYGEKNSQQKKCGVHCTIGCFAPCSPLLVIQYLQLQPGNRLKGYMSKIWHHNSIERVDAENGKRHAEQRRSERKQAIRPTGERQRPKKMCLIFVKAVETSARLCGCVECVRFGTIRLHVQLST